MARTFILPFLLALITIGAKAQTANIVGFEYWFDQSDAARIYVPLAPNASVSTNNQPLNTTGLSLGQHVAHFRLKDVQNGNVRWSVVTGRALTVGQPGPYEIVAIRYWWSNLASPPLGTDMRYKYFDTPQQVVQYNAPIDLCGFPTGAQVLKMQLLDNHNQWSSVVTRPVQINPAGVLGITTISSTSSNFCPGDTVTFTATPQTGTGFATPTNYAWTVPATDGWSAVASTEQNITVVVGNAAGNVQVTASNHCGSSALASFAVNIPTLPVQPGLISGPLQACAGSSATFSVPAVGNVTYAWAITGGWSATGGPGASFQTTIGPTNATIRVTPINACGFEGISRVEQIVVTTPPEAGENGDLALCSNSDPVDLFTALNGNPETGGTWSGPSSTTGSFDPSSMQPGNYVYTVAGSGACADATATVSVSVTQLPNAGADSTLQLCSNAGPADMRLALAGVPDSGGTWTGPSTTTGTYDPASMNPGIYTYTVSGNTVCPDASALLNVTEQMAPNAGIGGAIEVCRTATTIALLNELGGDPDVQGIWTGPNGIFIWIFNPTSDPEGNYRYVVQGTGVCPSDSADLFVNVMDLDISSITGPTEILEQGQVTYQIAPNLSDADSVAWTFPTTWTWAGDDADHFDATATIQTSGAALNDFICATAFGGGCTGQMFCLPINFTVGIDPTAGLANSVSVYPNPSNGLFHIVTDASIPVRDLIVLDAVGRQQHLPTMNMQQGRIELDLGEEAAGAYTLRLRVGDVWKMIPVVVVR